MEVKHIVLKKYAPYYQDSILFDIEEGDVDLSTNYQYSKTDKDTDTKLSGLSVLLRNLKLKKRDGAGRVSKHPYAYDPKHRNGSSIKKEASLGEFSTQKGAILVQAPQRWKTQSPVPLPRAREREERQEKKEENRPRKGGQAEKPWVVKLGKISVEDYQIKGEDQTPAEPVTVMIDEIRLKADNLSTAEGQKGNASLALRLNQRGTISTEGTVGINPISANLKMSLKDIEMKPFQPYFTDKVKITVTDGALSTTGNFTLGSSDKKELKATYSGEASLNHFASIDKQNAEDFLKMESLALDDLHFDSNPFSMDIKGIALSNFYARVLINPDGNAQSSGNHGERGGKERGPCKEGSSVPGKEGC